MADSWIKLSRDLLKWEHYQDPIIPRVWIHLLLTATAQDYEYGDIHLRCGEVATTYERLANELRISVKQCRRVIGQLVRTNEVRVMGRNKGSRKLTIYYINKYNDYQTNPKGRVKGSEMGDQNGEKGQSRGQTEQEYINKNIFNKSISACARENGAALPGGVPAEKRPAENNVSEDAQRLTEIPEAYRARFGNDVEAFRKWVAGK